MPYEEYDVHASRYTSPRRRDPIGERALRFAGRAGAGFAFIFLAFIVISILAGIVTELAKNLVLREVLVTIAIGVPALCLCAAVGYGLDRVRHLSVWRRWK